MDSCMRLRGHIEKMLSSVCLEEYGWPDYLPVISTAEQGDTSRSPWPVKMSAMHLFPGSLMQWTGSSSSSYSSDRLGAALTAGNLTRYRRCTSRHVYLISDFFLGSPKIGQKPWAGVIKQEKKHTGRVIFGGDQGFSVLRPQNIIPRSPQGHFYFPPSVPVTLNIMSIGSLPHLILCCPQCFITASWTIMLVQTLSLHLLCIMQYNAQPSQLE